MYKFFVRIRFDIEGFHHYPDAPDEVSFLRNRHRHIFKFSVKIRVGDVDREVEFVTLKNKLIGEFNQPHDFGTKSCEQIACETVQIVRKYSDFDYIEVEVSEDGENSGIAVYEKV